MDRKGYYVRCLQRLQNLDHDLALDELDVVSQTAMEAVLDQRVLLLDDLDHIADFVALKRTVFGYPSGSGSAWSEAKIMALMTFLIPGRFVL